MSYSYLIDDLGINRKYLDEKKQQTDYKIKYVVEYVINWLRITVHRQNITKVSFVDCMCNAGIYRDGDLCTAMRILLLFRDTAKRYPNKQFNILLNDIDEDRIKICTDVANKLISCDQPKNLNTTWRNMDVNEYLTQYQLFCHYFDYNEAGILFVDPYNFRTVILEKLTKFIERYYCEVIFNIFTSDFVRNGIDEGIRKCIGDTAISNKEELISYIVQSLMVGKMKHSFSYDFRTSTNTELYQIIFVTPHIKGLMALKEALWNTFNGKYYHRNYEENPQQVSFLTMDDDRQMLLDEHAGKAMLLLQNEFKGKTTTYNDIEKYLLEKTMLLPTHTIRNVVKPLVSQGIVQKQGLPKSKANYKEDMYYFIEGKHV